MRSTLRVITSLALAACANDSNAPATPMLLRTGSMKYHATTLAGRPLLTGWLNIEVLEDSTIVGTWKIQWASGSDTAAEVGDQVGSGSLSGRQSEDHAYLDLNPGYADNNVVLVAAPIDGGLAGTWAWSTISGPRTIGLFSALSE